jgi:hypothetical protein
MRRIFLPVIISAFFSFTVVAQTNSILPFTGIKYFREGVWGKQIEVTVNGNTLTSNKIPVNTDFEIKLLEPRGFIPDAAGKYYPGIKVLLMNTKKDTLGYSPNIFSKNESIGFSNASFKSLRVSLGFNTAILKPRDTVYQYITFFDTKSSNKLLLEFPVVIADSLQLGDWISTASGTRGYNAAACGSIQFKKIEVYLDSTYYPQSLYHSIRSAEMLGITTAEINKGSFTTWVYDEKMKELPAVKESKQYAAKTFTGKEEVNILVQVPLNPADKNNKNYTVRYRWQSSDGKKVIDIVNRFLY